MTARVVVAAAALVALAGCRGLPRGDLSGTPRDTAGQAGEATRTALAATADGRATHAMAAGQIYFATAGAVATEQSAIERATATQAAAATSVAATATRAALPFIDATDPALDGVNCGDASALPNPPPPVIDITRVALDYQGDQAIFTIGFDGVADLYGEVMAQGLVAWSLAVNIQDPALPLPPGISGLFSAANRILMQDQALAAGPEVSAQYIRYQSGWGDSGVEAVARFAGNQYSLALPAASLPVSGWWYVLSTNNAACDVAGFEQRSGTPSFEFPADPSIW